MLNLIPFIPPPYKNRQNVNKYTLAVVFIPTIFILHLPYGRNKPFLFHPFYFLPLSVLCEYRYERCEIILTIHYSME